MSEHSEKVSAQGLVLSDEQERAIVRRVLDDVNKDLADREDWMQNRERLYKKYRGVTSPKEFPWPNCSNLHLPVTMTAVETIHPRIKMMIICQDHKCPCFPVSP